MSFVTIPIFPSSSFDRTAQFYSRLGFVEIGRYPGEYLSLRRADGIELHFWSKPDVDCLSNDVACYLRFDTEAAARALHDSWAGIDVTPGRLTAPEATDYGLLEFGLVDPDGNLMRIGGSLNAVAPR